MPITLEELQKKGDINTISLTDLQKKGDVKVVSQPLQSPTQQSQQQGSTFTQRYLQASKQAREEGIEKFETGAAQFLERGAAGDKLGAARGAFKGMAGVAKGTVGSLISGALGAAQPAIKKGVEAGQEIGSNISALTPDIIENAFKGETKNMGMVLKSAWDLIPKEKQKAITDFAMDALDIADFTIVTGGTPGFAKGVATRVPKVVSTTKKVVQTAKQLPKGATVGKEIVERGIDSFRNTLRTSKNIEKDIISGLDEGVIEAFEADQLAKEFGIELPASSLATPAKARSEQILAEGFFGGELKARATKAVDDFTKAVENVQSKAQTSGELGEDILNQFKKVEAVRKKVIKDLYDNVTEIEKTLPINKKIVIETKNAQKLVTELIDRKQTAFKTGIGSAKEIQFLKNIEKGLKANKDFETLRATLKEVGELANFDSFTPTTDEKLFRKLYGSLKNDIDKAIKAQVPELDEALTTANTAFKEFETLKERPFIKSIQKLGKAGDVDTLADKLTKTKVSTNEVKQIYNTLGDETKEKIQNKIIADILESAKSPTVGFKPAGFASQLKKIGDERLAALLTSEQITLLKNLDKLNQAVSRGTALSKGSQTAMIQQVTRILAAPATSGGSVISEWLLARIFNSKAGQLWLKGLNKETVKALKQAKVKGNINAKALQKTSDFRQGEIPQTTKQIPKAIGGKKTLLHGTTKDFIEFAPPISSKLQTHGKGIYLTERGDVAKQFGDKVKNVDIDLSLVVDSETVIPLKTVNRFSKNLNISPPRNADSISYGTFQRFIADSLSKTDDVAEFSKNLDIANDVFRNEGLSGIKFDKDYVIFDEKILKIQQK